ncbi:trans-sulfuration enzyme family protein [Erysipelatoclostridium sp. AM42-17]|uniref:trans-sulfuration enzyme family protein n=1 Tax=Erysipelatoclostridium sp. AM42-17 TaxID=2293102 RepID=UPI000E5080DF|nr:PLP-dependent aspartate aminotransferase family protein [Erysipelatoclostridium sp. AM42-17]RHS94574.1 PLP-dependent transferase [Erysipelatoclostridium sp. AM42-17]
MTLEIETRCIHSLNHDEKQHPYGAFSIPIYQTAIFSHPGIGESQGYNYTRESNPTRAYLEEIISSLEGAVDTVACSSGMAAITIVSELFKSDDHIICGSDLYGGSTRLFKLQEKKGLHFSYVDTTNLDTIKQAITKQTKAIFIETPSNPTMQISDIQAISQLCKEYHLLLIVDNTFLSPYFQNPLKLGADIVVHSATKFLSGHNDVIAGTVSTHNEQLAQEIRNIAKTVGNTLAPIDCYLLTRGIKTLAIRQERQQENAIQLAKWLKKNPLVKDVYYPGLSDHPGYDIQVKQARGFGSMISFRVVDKEVAKRVLTHVKVITYAESLGGVESLITYPMVQTHSDVDEKTRNELGITDDFLRLSVGIENIKDLIQDLSEAFKNE